MADEKSSNVAADVLTPELVFGLVGPLGSNVDAAQDAIMSELKKFGYDSVLIHLTKDALEVIPALKNTPLTTYEAKIQLMNEAVKASGRADFLAAVAIALIKIRRADRNRLREDLKDIRDINKYQAVKTAYIIRQLKRPEEVRLLEKIYGKKFVQVSIAASEEEQAQAAMNIIGRETPHLPQEKREERANSLILRDKNEADAFGQGLINTYHAADVFVAGNTTEICAQISRFIEAFFGSNFISPTKDEFGSFLAKTASLRSLDLSRQVGSAICSKAGDLITMGCNEVPKAFGGNYWCDDPRPQRDIERGVEPNKLETNRIISNFVHALSKMDNIEIRPEDVLNHPDFDRVIKDAFVSDITEFGRITHAEMSALADAARLGRSTFDATIYVTTFPCHNCAKHLIAAGISRIVYIEPYAKSKAFELSSDALTKSVGDNSKVLVEHFVGISPRRYQDIFEKHRKRRDFSNRVIKWQFDFPIPMIPDRSGTHISIEFQALEGFDEALTRVAKAFQV